VRPQVDPDQPHRRADTITTARRLRRDAADLEAKAKALLERADVLRDAAARLEAAEGLPGTNKVRTVHQHMQIRTHGEKVRPTGPGRPSESTHPFPLALAKKGLTVADWAAKHGYEETVVRSWYRTTQRRKVPRAAASLIAKELGLAADETTWPQGLK
jgi:hypothetical protein